MAKRGPRLLGESPALCIDRRVGRLLPNDDYGVIVPGVLVVEPLWPWPLWP